MRTPAALLLVALIAIAACTTAPASAPPASAPAPSAGATESSLLLTLAYRGGHCRTGPCDREVAIDREGQVLAGSPNPQVLGTLAPDLFQRLQEQLSVADFERLGSLPFSGECPVNFDGQELIYTFYGAGGEIRLASCEVELDPSDPLFVSIENALAAFPVP